MIIPKAMLKFYRPSAVLLFLASIITLGGVACTAKSVVQPTVVNPVPVTSQSPAKPAAKPTPKSAAKPKPSANYKLALDKADAAQNISQSAQSPEDWNLVVSQWEQAVNLLKKVPANDPNKKLVSQKLTAYQASLATARTRADRSGQVSGATLDPMVAVDPLVTVAPIEGAGAINQVQIKYRDSRIPVIEVLFDGRRSFDMMVDTGASGTMITPDMADALEIEVIGSSTAMTPAGLTEVDIGVVKSMRVGNRTVRNIQVAIGPVRLLGHDFFGNCDLTIRQSVVEFGQCS
jgi:predicted aspartyl protease